MRSVCVWKQCEMVPRAFNMSKRNTIFLRNAAGKIAPSCSLGKPITTQDLVHLVRSRSKPCNKSWLFKETDVGRSCLVETSLKFY